MIGLAKRKGGDIIEYGEFHDILDVLKKAESMACSLSAVASRIQFEIIADLDRAYVDGKRYGVTKASHKWGIGDGVSEIITGLPNGAIAAVALADAASDDAAIRADLRILKAAYYAMEY